MAGITNYRDPGLFGLHRLNRFLDEAFAGMPGGAEQGNVITSAWFAPTDVSEDANGIQISMELPGVQPDDVRLSLENNILTIRGEKRHQADEKNERVHRFERTYGTFERTFVLPSTVDSEQIEARYDNGVLFISVPKAERAKPREIQVKSSASGSSQVRSGSQTQRIGQQGSSEERNEENGSTQRSSSRTTEKAGAR